MVFNTRDKIGTHTSMNICTHKLLAINTMSSVKDILVMIIENI